MRALFAIKAIKERTPARIVIWRMAINNKWFMIRLVYSNSINFKLLREDAIYYIKKHK